MVRVEVTDFRIERNATPIYGIGRSEPLGIRYDAATISMDVRGWPNSLLINNGRVRFDSISLQVTLFQNTLYGIYPNTRIEGILLEGSAPAVNMIGTYDINTEGEELVGRRIQTEGVELFTDEFQFGGLGFVSGTPSTYISSATNFTGPTWNFLNDRPRSPYLESQMLLFREAPDPLAELDAVKEEIKDLEKQLERMRRGEELLKEVLGEGRYKDFIRTGFITVSSKLYPNRTYIVKEEGKVEVIENGRLIETLCLVSTESVGKQDVLALKKLLLEQNETMFLKTANHFNERGSPMASTTPEQQNAPRRQVRDWFNLRTRR